MNAADQAKKMLTTKLQEPKTLKPEDFVSTGITPMNLAISGRISGGLAKGRIYHIAGRSSGGKTFLCRGILAEAALNKNFADYELCYDDVERGALMDDAKFFGKAFMQRLTSPAVSKKGMPIHSRTVSDFLTRLRKRLDAGKPVIWIEDSLDSLVPDRESKMGDGKAKAYSQELRKLIDPIAATGSILVLTSQARANMNAMSLFDDQDIISGGRALEHYPTLSIILRKSRTLRKPHKGVKYIVGHMVKALIKKNRVSGKDRIVYFPFNPDYGIDDLGACVEYLIQVKHWRPIKDSDSEDEDNQNKEVKAIKATEFNFEGDKEKLIQKIETESLQQELRVLTGKIWKGIDNALRIERKPRYQ